MSESKHAPVRDILIAARRLIEKPENWIRRASARDSNGRSISATNPAATCFCAYGALVRAHGDYKACQPGYSELCAAARNASIIGFNDSHSHPEVLAVFDRAIAKATGSAS